MFTLVLLTLACAPKTPASSAPRPRSLYEAPAAEATRTPSGLAVQVLREGTGTGSPGPQSRVTVHYSGWTADGQLFDSSLSRGEPLVVRLDQVIPGWTEVVQTMVVGQQVRVWIPAELAYGYSGPVSGQLMFEIELLAYEP